MSDKPMTAREKFEELVWSAVLGLVLLGFLAGMSGLIVWGRL
jgi:hypothetical protein